MATNTEEILIKLGVDGSRLARDLRTTGQHLNDWAKGVKDRLQETFVGDIITKSLANPIIAATTALTAFGAKAALVFGEMKERAGEIKLGASMANMDPMTYQPWMQAAKATETSPEGIGKAVLKVAEAQQKVMAGKDGAAAALRAFNELGVSFNDIKTMGAEQLWLKIANSLHVAKLSSEQLVAGVDVMGKSFASLEAMFKRGTGSPLDQFKVFSEEEYKNLLEIKKLQAINKAVLDKMWEEAVSASVSAAVSKPQGVMGHLITAAIPAQYQLALKLWQKMSGADAIAGAMAQDDANKHSQEEANRIAIERAKATSAAELRKLEQKQIREMHKEAAKIEADAALKQLSIEGQITELYRQRNELIDEISAEGKTIEERAKTAKELAQNQLAITTKELELKQALKGIDEAREKLAFDTNRRAVSMREPYMPSISELANSGTWLTSHNNGTSRFQQGPYARTAREIQWYEADAKQAMSLGNTDWANKDISRINFLKEGLRAAGVLGPDTHLESMDESLKVQQKHLQDLLDKANGKGGGVAIQATEGP